MKEMIGPLTPTTILSPVQLSIVSIIYTAISFVYILFIFHVKLLDAAWGLLKYPAIQHVVALYPNQNIWTAVEVLGSVVSTSHKKVLGSNPLSGFTATFVSKWNNLSLQKENLPLQQHKTLAEVKYTRPENPLGDK